MDTELLGTTMLKHFLAPSNILRSNIPEGDKGITWDGYIDVYNQNPLNPAKDPAKNPARNPWKGALLAQVPVQVKGHVEKRVGSTQTYDLECADLQNYQTKDGTIFFQGRADEKGGNERIFYKAFLSGDAAELVRTARGKQTRRIALDPFPTELSLAETLLTEFAKAMRDETKPKGEKRWADYAPAELKPLPTPEPIPDPAWDNPYLYSAETVKFRGREDEMERLRAFLNAPGPFLWWAYVAPGGTGKTRLAWELRKALEAEGVWTVRTDHEAWLREYGALSADEMSRRLQSPTLLILDYAQQFAKELGCWLAGLTTQALRFYQPLRLLLLERADKDQDDKYPWEKELYQNADEYRLRQRLYAEVRELPALEDAATLGVIRDFAAALRAREEALPELAAGEEKEILQRLKDTPHTDRRPLFAMLVTDAWLRGDRDPARSWEGLVEGPVERERKLLEDRLRKEIGSNELLKAAVFDLWRTATVLGAVGDPELEKIASLCTESFATVREAAREAKIREIDLLQRLGLLDGTGKHFHALHPDLFGELFVLKAMETMNRHESTSFFVSILSDCEISKILFIRCLFDYPSYVSSENGLADWFLPGDMELEDEEKSSYVCLLRELFDISVKKAHRDWIVTRMEEYARNVEDCSEAAVIYFNLASVYQDRDDYTNSLKYYKKAYEKERKESPEKIFSNSIRNYTLALIYRDMGNYPMALRLLKKDITFSDEVTVNDDSGIGVAYSNMAVIFSEIGNYPKAMELLEKALTIQENLYDTDNRAIASIYNSFAVVHHAMGNFQNALDYCHKAQVIQEKVVGLNHPDVAMTYNNLTAVYQSIGDYYKALEYSEKASLIMEQVFGKYHSKTAVTYCNMATIYEAMRAHKEALEYGKKALEILEKTVGLNHPYTINAYNILTMIYHEIEEYDQARMFAQQALDKAIKVFGMDHPTTAQTYNNMAIVLGDLRDFRNALVCHEKAIWISEKIFGQDHPSTGSYYFSLAMCYIAMDYNHNALECLIQAETILEKVIGIENPYIATIYYILARLYHAMGNSIESVKYHKKACEIREKVLGVNHPDTVKSYNNLVKMYRVVGDNVEALKTLHKLLNRKEADIEEDNLETAAICNGIGVQYLYWERPYVAKPWLRRSLYTREMLLGSDSPYTQGTRIALEFAEKMIQKEEKRRHVPYQERYPSIQTIFRYYPSVLQYYPSDQAQEPSSVEELDKILY